MAGVMVGDDHMSDAKSTFGYNAYAWHQRGRFWWVAFYSYGLLSDGAAVQRAIFTTFTSSNGEHIPEERYQSISLCKS